MPISTAGLPREGQTAQPWTPAQPMSLITNRRQAHAHTGLQFIAS